MTETTPWIVAEAQEDQRGQSPPPDPRAVLFWMENSTWGGRGRMEVRGRETLPRLGSSGVGCRQLACVLPTPALSLCHSAGACAH